MAKSKKQSSVAPKTDYSKYLIRLVLVVTSFILYSNTLKHGFTLDDDIYFLKHSSVQKGTKGIAETFTYGSMEKFDGSKGLQPYRPMSLTISAIQKQMTGNDPAAAHFFNVLLYALLGIAIHIFLSRLFPGMNPWITGLMALLFLVHPVHTEVVASIKSRDEILTALFGIIALMYCLRPSGKPNQIVNLLLSGVFFLLAMFSKENGIAFLAIAPVMLLLLRKETPVSVLIKSIPFVLAAALFLFIRYKVIGDTINYYQKTVLENVLYGVRNNAELWATKAEILLYYPKLLFIPYPLTWDYSFNYIPLVTWSNAMPILSVLAYLLLGLLAILNLKKQPVLSFSVFFFLATLLPTRNLLFLTGSTFAERFLFLPSVGFSIGLIYSGVLLFRLDPASLKGKNRNVFVAVLTSVLLLFSGMTITRNKDWKSNFTIFQSGVKASPNSTRANASLASEYRTMAEKESDPAKRNEYLNSAVQYYQTALDILPSNTYASYNLGVTLSMMGKNDDAEKAYRLTLSTDSINPLALNNMAFIYSGKQLYDSALVYLLRLKRVNPEDLLTNQNLAAVYFLKNDFEESIKYADKAIQLDPTSAKSYQIMSETYRMKNMPEESARYLELFNKYNR
jgi:protein O-mannosyl-transferase